MYWTPYLYHSHKASVVALSKLQSYSRQQQEVTYSHDYDAMTGAFPIMQNLTITQPKIVSFFMKLS